MVGMARVRVAAMCFLALLGLSHAGYSTSDAKTALYAAASSYCPSSKINSWSCNYCGLFGQLQNVSATHDKHTNNQGFVGYDSGRNIIWVSFRGTDGASIKNWVENLDAKKKHNFPLSCSSCIVHSGFYHAYNSIKSEIQSQVSHLHQTYRTAPVHVTGHSLGAAMASVCAVDLYESLGIRVSKLITFGEPRTGNSNFATHLRALVGEAYRVTHHKDIVPHVPFKSMGFHHISTEVYYRDATHYKICNGSGEDGSCANHYHYLWEWRVKDHLHYLGYHIGSSACS